MKRLYLGLGLLILLLAGGWLLSQTALRLRAPICSHLEKAADAALAQDWEAAREFTAAAQGHWDACRSILASFSDHEPIEQMNQGFAQIHAFLQQKDSGEFAAACAGLAQLANAIADSQTVTWWSLL